MPLVRALPSSAEKKLRVNTQPCRSRDRSVSNNEIVMSTRADLIDKYETTYTLTTMEYKVKLGKSKCDYRQFDLYPIDGPSTAKGSGTVLTASVALLKNTCI